MLKKVLNIIPLLLSLLVVFVTVFSWLASIYGWGGNNLISAEGMRWFVASFMDNIKQSPWDYILLLTLTISVIKESEILAIRGNKNHLKRRRAYLLVGVLIFVLAVIVAILSVLPGNIMLNAFGQFDNSPLQHGLLPIGLLTLIFISLVYGYASGRFTGLAEMIGALTKLLVNIADYFVTLIVASILIATLKYAFFDNSLMHESSVAFVVLYILLFFIPWILHVVFAYRKNGV